MPAKKLRTVLRFRVDENGCWLWTRSCQPSGYGQVRHRGTMALVHRVVAEHHGHDIAGKHVHHLCGVRRCANPAHLVVMDPSDHARMKRERCRRGHDLTTEGSRDPDGHCRECRRLRTRTRRLAAAA